MFIGIDLGTSAVKGVLVDAEQRILAAVEQPIAPRQPRPGWSEDDADAWWAAVLRGMDRLAAVPADWAASAPSGPSGRCTGALLLDAADRPVRPAILWNDGRAAAEAAELARGPHLSAAGRRARHAGLHGAEARLARPHEPAALDRPVICCCPRTGIRLQAHRRARDRPERRGRHLAARPGPRAPGAPTAAACGLDPAWLPPIVESTAVVGRLGRSSRRAGAWRPDRRSRAAAGDTAVGGVGIGAVARGPGVRVARHVGARSSWRDDAYRPDRRRDGPCASATRCPAPGTAWRRCSTARARSPQRRTGLGMPTSRRCWPRSEQASPGPSPLARPALSLRRADPPQRPAGPRRPVRPRTLDRPADIVQAMMEGVAFSLRDGLDALPPGTRSRGWASSEAGRARRFGAGSSPPCSACRWPSTGAQCGPAFGAARLARLGLDGEDPRDVAVEPAIERMITPDPALCDAYAARLPAFRSLYGALKPEFARHRREDVPASAAWRRSRSPGGRTLDASRTTRMPRIYARLNVRARPRPTARYPSNLSGALCLGTRIR